MIKTKVLQKGHTQVPIYKGAAYSMLHKFRGRIKGIVIYSKAPQIIMIPIGAIGMANSEGIYVNLGFCTEIREI